MKTIEEFSNNEFTIVPASLYTTLKKFLAAELVELKHDKDDNKKVYKITNNGKYVLEKEIERKKQMVKFAQNFLDQRSGVFMKSKYVMIGGFALSEENDMEKFKNYASQGQILEDIIGGLFYKLKKDKPQDIVYSLDYQLEANEEYFSLFKEAGWELVLSIGNQMHIFSSQAGTKPIYSDCESEV